MPLLRSVVFIDKCFIMMRGLIMAEEHLKAPTDDLGVAQNWGDASHNGQRGPVCTARTINTVEL